ncbi:MAG: GxxExxY protein [Phycisphaerae bacterium]
MPLPDPIPEELDRIGAIIVDAAFKVHKRLGPGLLEKVYKICLAHELTLRGLKVEREIPVNIRYEDITVMEAYYMDLFVEDAVIVEVKAERDHPVFRNQTRTHITLAEKRLGYLINFNVPLIKDGITRIAV